MNRYRGVAQLVDQQVISPTQYTLFMEILSFNRSNSIDGYQVYFSQWEEKLNAYSSIDETEKIPLYCMLSVGKDSATYWLDQLANIGSSDWSQWLVSPDHGKEVGIKWWQGDAAGAFVGAVVGSSVPGVGTCAGAVTGAVCGSASVILTNCLNSLF